MGQAPIHNAVLGSGDRPDARVPTLDQIFACKADPDIVDANGWSSLHHAAYNGDYKCVVKLVENKAKVNSISNQFRTPLHLAAQQNHPHIVNYLLRCKDSGKEAKDELGCTPLHLACKKSGQIDCVEILLEQRANIMAVDNRNWTSLHYAAYNGHPKVINFLVKFEADADKLSHVKTS